MQQQHRDIYTKPAPSSGPATYEPMRPPEGPPHRRALILVALMALVSLGVYVYFQNVEPSEDELALERLAEPQPVAADTNAPPDRRSRSAMDAVSVETLLTDLGVAAQTPPPTLSPQKMAEAMSYIRSAQQYIRSRDMDQAEAEVRKAMEVWPDMNLAIRLLGSIYTQRGQFDQAIVLLEKSLAKEPFSAEVLNNLAINYMQKGMMDKAEEMLMTSLQVRPEYGVAFVNLGFVHLRLGRYDLAAENFELGLRSMPDNPGVLNNLAVCLIRLGDYAGARERLQALIELAPNRATAYFNMAISYVLEQNVASAMEWVRRGADFCSPTQLRTYLADSDFDSIRMHPDFQSVVRERFPDIPTVPPPPP